MSKLEKQTYEIFRKTKNGLVNLFFVKQTMDRKDIFSESLDEQKMDRKDIFSEHFVRAKDGLVKTFLANL